MTATAHPAPLGLRLTGTVPASDTLDIDTIPLADFAMLRYFLSAKAGSLAKSMDISAVNQSSVLTDSVFGKVGGSLALGVAVVVSGTDAVLRITNPNGFTVSIETIRLRIGL